MTDQPVNLANLLEVPVRGLRPGMYVAALDRPWLEVPFALQGFQIKDEEDAAFVARHCDYVYIDPLRKATGEYLPKQRRRTRRTAEPDKVSLKSEFKRMDVEFDSAAGAIEKVFEQIRLHRRFDLSAMQDAISPLVDSVLRNRDALAALMRLKRKGDYLFNHSMACVVWASVLGRHLGIARHSLKQLALGVSVMDVGMTELPDEMLSKTGALEPQERELLRGHVAASLEIVRNSGEVAEPVLNLIACHHERHDGSGYPQQLSGNDIPMMARIAALVDSYDAMITERPYASARSSFVAIQELVDSKGLLFQDALVEQFVQAVGLFPTGSVVELNTGEVGVVVQQNDTRRLRPKIVLILDEHKQQRADFPLIDLSKYSPDARGHATIWISRDLEAGAYGIAPDDYFL